MVMLRNMGPLIQQKKMCLLVWVVLRLYLPADYISRSHHPSPQQLVEKRTLGICDFSAKKNKINCPDAATQKAVSASTLCRSVKTNFKKVIWLWWKSNLTVELGTTSHSNSPICVTARSWNDIAKFLKCKTWQTRAALDCVSTRLSTVPVCRTR